MKLRNFGALLVALVVAALPAYAQEQSGAVEGVVSDATGAVVPGVTVEARSTSGAVSVDDERHERPLQLPRPSPGELHDLGQPDRASPPSSTPTSASRWVRPSGSTSPCA